VRRIAAGLAAVGAVAMLGAPPARAETRAEAQILAERAANSSAALERLRSVREVDGVPVDFRAALDARGAELERRLDELSASLVSGVAPPDASKATADARDILAERRFHGSDVPRPFRGVLEWLGETLGRGFDWLGGRLPGGLWTLWTIVSAAVILLALLVAGRVARRRGGVLVERARTARFARKEDPDALERAADDAERAGELERALRLRFRAGLIRLARRGAIPARDSITSGEIRRLLALPEFDRLSRTFDEVVYGDRAAVADDVGAAKRAWPRVLEQAPVR
jgi:hypothetical protein